MKADPSSVYSYQDVTDAYFNQNRLEEAKTVAEQGLAKQGTAIGLRRQLMDLAYLRGDMAEIDRHVASMKGTPEEYFVLFSKALIEFNLGRHRDSAKTFREAQVLAQKFGNTEFAAVLSGALAFTSSLVGDCSSAKSLASASLEQSPAGSTLSPSSVALANCAESSRAAQTMDVLGKLYPRDTLLNLVRKPVTLALVATRAGKNDEALALLEPARRIELGVGPGSAVGLAPYVRGLVYLNKKDGANAALEFRKILDRRYLFASAPTYSLSQLGLARAYALHAGSVAPASNAAVNADFKTKARTGYQDFLATWKDADPGLAPLEQAKAEYAKLQ